MHAALHYGILSLFPLVILVHAFTAPYTKVEESFNIQAVHDIFRFGVDFANPKEHLNLYYDHVKFPGSVPRTFIGALVLAQSLRPFAFLTSDPARLQIIARSILGLSNAASLWAFTQAVNQAFGKPASYWFVFLQVSQFHVMYYASRTLPNTFAFTLTTLSLRFYITSSFGNRSRRSRKARVCLYLMTIAGIIFRSELAILVACLSGFLLLRGVSIRTVILPAGVAALALGLLTTVMVDSFFWQKFPLWPEWIAFRYNTIEGKSSDWGVSPPLWYFTNALPRLMLNPLALIVCVPMAWTIRSTRKFSMEIVGPLVAFVVIYSLLPHKEWRFIIYIIPGLTAVAAAGASWIWVRRGKRVIYRVLTIALIGSTALSFVASMVLLYLSSLNYPGGIALTRLHALAEGQKDTVSIHLDNLSCQTGVTRFLQRPPSERLPFIESNGTSTWIYDKTEGREDSGDVLFWRQFDYVLAEDVSKVPGEWEIVESVYAFAGVGLLRGIPPPYEAPQEDLLVSSPKGPVRPQHRASELLQRFENFMRRKITRGLWIDIKMRPKLFILRNKLKS